MILASFGTLSYLSLLGALETLLGWCHAVRHGVKEKRKKTWTY